MAYDGDVNAHIIDPLAQYVPDPELRAQVRQVLIDARALIAKRGGWTQRTEHRTLTKEVEVEVPITEIRERPVEVGRLWWRKTHYESYAEVVIYRTKAALKVGEAFCMIGAVKRASSKKKVTGQALKVISSHLGVTIDGFNDEGGRRKKEVLAVFDQLIGPVVA